MRNWQFFVKLGLSLVAAVVTYLIANNIIKRILDNIEEMSQENTYDKPGISEADILDPKEVINKNTEGDNGADQKKTEKTVKNQ